MTDVPLALVIDLLARIDGAVHDRPVQQALVARLCVETGWAGDDELRGRALTALDRAGEQSRSIMWACSTPSVRRSHAGEDLARWFARAAGPEGTTVDVHLDDDVEQALLDRLVHAAHLTAVPAVLAGTCAVRQVTVATDAEGVELALRPLALHDEDPFVQLGALALAPGHLDADGDGVRLRAPM